jgi:hypothetical protein
MTQQTDSLFRNTKNTQLGLFQGKLFSDSIDTQSLRIFSDLSLDAIVTALDFAPTGLVGAHEKSRYVGATTSGPPTLGTFQVGDYVVSRNNGLIYVCVVGGSPGTWTTTTNFLPLSGGVMSGPIDMNGNNVTDIKELEISGIDGARERSAYSGATMSNHPTSGTFQIGDYVIAQDGNLWVCRASGSPGTWENVNDFLQLAGGTMRGDINMGGSAVNNASYLSPFGLTADTQNASRYVGATTSGAPMAGVYQVGDYIIAQDGHIFICTTAPNTWTAVGGPFLPLAGGTMSGDISMGGNAAVNNASYLSPFGLTVQTQNASRYVGATTSGAPMAGVYQVGDYIIAQDGHFFICTTAPNTWTSVASSDGPFLPLAGGTMSGAINLNTSNVTNGGTITGSVLNATTQYQLNASRVLSSPDSKSLSLGFNALSGSVSGITNTIVGCNSSPVSLTTGNNNVTVGYATLTNTTAGVSNVAIGATTLNGNISGNFNTGVGQASLAINTGSFHTTIGYAALSSNTGADANTAIGASALALNSTGNGQVAIGQAALTTNTTGSYNTAIGRNSLTANSIGQSNTSVGYNALSANTANENTAVGYCALLNSTGDHNTAIGYNCLLSNTTGSENTGIGYCSLLSSISGTGNTAVGYKAIQNTTGSSSTAVGNLALSSNTTGMNCALGDSASSNSTMTGNTAMGVSATSGASTAFTTIIGFASLTGGSGSTFVGSSGGRSNSTNITGLGKSAANGTFSFFPCAMGAFALGQGTNQMAVGYGALAASTSSSSGCVGIGYFSLGATTSGTNNVGCGYSTCSALTTSSGNICVGYATGNSGTTVAMATKLGALSLNLAANGCVTVGYNVMSGASGASNTGVGYGALSTLTTGTSNTTLGYQANVSTNALGSCIILGYTATATTSSQLVIKGCGSGTGTLSGGTATVSGNFITDTSIIILSATSSSAPGNLAVTARDTGSNPHTFTVTSSSATDASTFNYLIFEG